MRITSKRLLVAALLFSATACATPDYGWHASGAVIAASNFLHPPFSSRDEAGDPVGLEVELLAAAAEELGREVLWVEREFSYLIEAAASGEVSVSASTIGVTEARAERVRFSEPYFETRIIALVRAGEGEPRSLGELAGRPVAADRGTTAVAALAAGAPDAIPVHDRGDADSWAPLLADGTIDAIVLDESHVDAFSTSVDATFHVLPTPLARERFAFAVAPGQDALLAALDRAVQAHRSAASSPLPDTREP